MAAILFACACSTEKAKIKKDNTDRKLWRHDGPRVGHVTSLAPWRQGHVTHLFHFKQQFLFILFHIAN